MQSSLLIVNNSHEVVVERADVDFIVENGRLGRALDDLSGRIVPRAQRLAVEVVLGKEAVLRQ